VPNGTQLRQCDANGAGLMLSSKQAEADYGLCFQRFFPFFHE
jgi:hypothetical protein